MTSAPEPAPDFAASIAYVIHQETLGGAACGWDHCSGCYDTEDGRPTGHYPHSDIFGCEVGSGCSECGGLGVVWSHYFKDELEDMACEVSAPAMSALSHPEPVAQEAVDERAAFEAWAATEWSNGQGVPHHAWTGWQGRAALRVRVAELESRATPIDDAELLELAEAEVKRMLATPPDSDAVRAELRDWIEALDAKIAETHDISLPALKTGLQSVLAALSNQGSSSNGQ